MKIATDTLEYNDPWGFNSSIFNIKPESKPVEGDIRKKNNGNGTITYTAHLQSVTEDYLIISKVKLNKIMGNDMQNMQIPERKVKVKRYVNKVASIDPLMEMDILSVTADSSLGDLEIDLTYSYSLITNEEKEVDIPKNGRDYALYSEVDTVKKTITYYLKNFSSKTVILKSVTESQDVSYIFLRDGVYGTGENSFFKYRIKKRDPRKSVALKPGANLIIRKETYAYLNFYEYADLSLEVLFKK
ncbi:hypothetical protein [Pontibacter cellulosilyticus]|uniref:Uncharacterized protein n=1 Tax=Pontibacter cellulosilyticus TaxID=1720253 RepID=A0A923N3V9_9BACT|nr:hypothetical protein [Pontibacter cellulosilyticus]MBC5991394.1 hypothetical protein [Pontibacter cellulosilyticus]